jgi:hypothetical protein
MIYLTLYLILVVLTWLIIKPFKIKKRQFIKNKNESFIYWFFMTFALSIMPLLSIVVILNVIWCFIIDTKNDDYI